METKHTAGPWRVGNGHSWNILAGERTLIGSAHFGGYTANAKERAEVDANARLIAASPMLYDYVQSKAKEGCNNAKEIIAKLGID